MEILEIAGVELVGVSACVPARAVDVVGSLAPLLGDKAAGVVEATGIRTRRVAGANTSAFDLCVAAADRLFAAAPDRAAYARSFGAVLFVSFTERTRMPSAAARAQARLDLPRDVLALDLSLACSGWVSGLHLAALLARETGRRVLLLDGDMQSAHIGEGDASTLPLLSDGGTAAVVAPSPSAAPWRFAFMSDGAKGGALRLDDGGMISMDGFAVFKFVAGEVTAFLRDFLAAAPGGFDAFVPHQANMYMVRQLAKSLGIAPERLWTSGERLGNLASASVPATIAACAPAALRAGRALDLFAAAFGGGLSAAAARLSLGPEARVEIFDHEC
ncbi:MAG: hypothetical protein IJ983_05645 [Kiritimatiellae bacterium]|nr:hypothetical protein [Kiritimatiellia bacterium]